jgi:hypothetical protein
MVFTIEFGTSQFVKGPEIISQMSPLSGSLADPANIFEQA